MKNIILLLTLLCASAVLSAEDPPNVNDYKWSATSKKASFEGKAKTSLLRKAFKAVQKELDGKAKAGEIEDNAVFSIVIDWKGKEFKRKLTAHKKYPVEIPRGHAKKAE